jgi:hypothetical protein
VVAADQRPILIVEVKSADMNLSKTLLHSHRWFPRNQPLGVQVVDKRGVLRKYSDRAWVISVERFLSLFI